MMICSVIYYIAYKTGYIQRTLTKKLAGVKDLKLGKAVAAVSKDDFREKLGQALKKSDFIIVIGGLSSGKDRNVMNVLSDYVNDTEMEITFNKRVLNPDGGKDGYLIRSIDKYIAVLPDEPDQVEKMFEGELIRNIKITPDSHAQMPEPVITHTVVFAPEQYDPLEQLGKKKKHNVFVIAAAIFGALTVAAAAAWIALQYL